MGSFTILGYGDIFKATYLHRKSGKSCKDKAKQSMSYVQVLAGGKVQIDKIKAFCHFLDGKIPKPNKKFSEIFNKIDSVIQQEHKDVTSQALSNCHGDWYEWLLSIAAINFYIEHNGSYLVLQLPNITQFDVARLYKDHLYELVVDLRKKVLSSASVKLVTSNPDFVIVDNNNTKEAIRFTSEINILDAGIIKEIENMYKQFSSICEFNGIIGFASAKFSLRPDRRLQIPHEGSLMKAIYTHIQTRQWIIDPPGLKYYAIAGEVSSADKEALCTVATHSLTTVHEKPKKAVDEVFCVNSINEANAAFKRMLQSTS
jgi:hypothetical protein